MMNWLPYRNFSQREMTISSTLERLVPFIRHPHHCLKSTNYSKHGPSDPFTKKVKRKSTVVHRTSDTCQPHRITSPSLSPKSDSDSSVSVTTSPDMNTLTSSHHLGSTSSYVAQSCQRGTCLTPPFIILLFSLFHTHSALSHQSPSAWKQLPQSLLRRSLPSRSLSPESFRSSLTSSRRRFPSKKS